MIVEILGWVSTGLTILSFIPKGEARIRLINGIACISWIVYGVSLIQYPIIVVNGIVLILHAKYFMQQKKNPINDFGYIEPDKKNDEAMDSEFMYKWIRKHSGKP